MDVDNVSLRRHGVVPGVGSVQRHRNGMDDPSDHSSRTAAPRLAAPTVPLFDVGGRSVVCRIDGSQFHQLTATVSQSATVRPSRRTMVPELGAQSAVPNGGDIPSSFRPRLVPSTPRPLVVVTCHQRWPGSDPSLVRTPSSWHMHPVRTLAAVDAPSTVGSVSGTGCDCLPIGVPVLQSGLSAVVCSTPAAL